MQKWEYLWVEFGDRMVKRINDTSVLEGIVYVKGEKIGDFLNRMGKDGWEAVSTNNYYIILKRPLATV